MIKKAFSAALCIICIISVFSGCKSQEKPDNINIVNNASEVYINGEKQDTVEAFAGAFQGSQGDTLEFIFPEEQEFNTIHIIEKTATVRQFNIYATIDGKETCIYTGKNIYNENIKLDTVKATTFKLEILNTDIKNDSFIIQGINVYNIKEK